MKHAWPIGLIIFFTLFISGIVVFVAWSGHQREDLVAPDYYDQEIHYQDRINATARAAAVGASSVEYHRDSETLYLRFQETAATSSSTGTVTLYRPSDAALDRVFAFAPGTSGVQAIVVNLLPGLWRVKADWSRDGQMFYSESTLMVP